MNFYIGVITKVLDPDLYTVEVDIPGENEKLNAFPMRGEVDEPRVGDVVFLRELDPLYHSYYLYEKLKENNFIGIRSRGKKIWMKEDFIQIGIIPPDSNEGWYDDNSGADQTPECTSWIKIDKEGNLEIEMEGGGKVHITADHEVKIDGNWKVEVGGDAKIEVGGNCDIKAGGSCKVDCPDVTITGGKLTVNGAVSPGSGMPFNCIPNCVFSGISHGNSIVNGT